MNSQYSSPEHRDDIIFPIQSYIKTNTDFNILLKALMFNLFGVPSNNGKRIVQANKKVKHKTTHSTIIFTGFWNFVLQINEYYTTITKHLCHVRLISIICFLFEYI